MFEFLQAETLKMVKYVITVGHQKCLGRIIYFVKLIELLITSRNNYCSVA